MVNSLWPLVFEDKAYINSIIQMQALKPRDLHLSVRVVQKLPEACLEDRSANSRSANLLETPRD